MAMGDYQPVGFALVSGKVTGHHPRELIYGTEDFMLIFDGSFFSVCVIPLNIILNSMLPGSYFGTVIAFSLLSIPHTY